MISRVHLVRSCSTPTVMLVHLLEMPIPLEILMFVFLPEAVRILRRVWRLRGRSFKMHA